MSDDFGFFSSSESAGAAVEAEEDPAAAFLAQQESEIAGIENDEGFGAVLVTSQASSLEQSDLGGYDDLVTTPMNGEIHQDSSSFNDGYAAIAQADRLTQEPESLRKWREEQKERLEELDAASKVTEQEWREKAKKDLEEWYQRQSEQIEKNKVTNRASDEVLASETKDDDTGTEWERVARLCDFNPKSSKQSKDVSRMRSVLISMKQTPLSR
ncbi:PREDICTED: clathrin light chain B isoform X3 [Nanorana parkeri]|uniref:clathrin light chain B isoform X3 n=1 Tax=Nanorana parkeri TaxID=125878 RepID=UPI000854356F|nr:PREDICTED: clathrin light chain B isoform X3 [Nanorana parkeri]